MGGMQSHGQVRNVRPELHNPGVCRVSGTAGPTQIASSCAEAMAERGVGGAFCEGERTRNRFGQSANRGQSGTLPRSIKGIEGAGPFQTKLAKRVAIAGPNRMSALEQKIVVVGLARDIVEIGKITDKYPLELWHVTAATAGCLAGF